MNIVKPYKVELYEVLPKDFYEANKHHGDKLWMMFDQRAIVTLSRLRERYGTVNLNTWWWEGDHQFRGWRPMDCSVGAKFSQHKFGRAFDCVFKHISAEEVRQDALKKPWHKPFRHITRMEKNVSWFHFDVGPVPDITEVTQTDQMIYIPRIGVEFKDD
jgi:hypothetical protein